METLKRTDLFKINPRTVVIDLEINPRKNYDIVELKESIRNEGVKEPVRIAKNKDGMWQLTHGFRRMTAVMELIDEGVDIAFVPCLKTSMNAESILLDHLTLNSGKPLNSLEIADTIYQLQGYGYSNKDITVKTGIAEVKISNLLTFAKEASKKIKDAVLNGEMTFTTALQIIRGSDSITEQNDLLDEAEMKALEEGETKVKSKHVKKTKKLEVTLEKHYEKHPALFEKGITHEYVEKLWKSGYKIVPL